MFFFFNDTATTEIYTLSLHDALPICIAQRLQTMLAPLDETGTQRGRCAVQIQQHEGMRSEEHTSELQSHLNLVCRLLLEKKNQFPLLPLHMLPTVSHTLKLCTSSIPN